MATSKLIVKSSKKGSLATVYLRFRQGRNIDYVLPTEFKIFPEYWNNKSQTFKQRINYTDHFTEKNKNRLVADFHDLMQFIMSENNQRAISGGSLLKEWLRDVIHRFHHTIYSGDTAKYSLSRYIEKFIKECENGERLYEHNNRQEKYKPPTIKNFKGFQTQFLLFQEQKKKLYTFDQITIDFYSEFVKFFIDKNYSPNTIGRNIKNLKTIMRAARDKGLHNNYEIDRKQFKTIKVEVQNIYLNDSEVEKLFNLDLSEKPILEVARDVFLIGCYTAQRFSDYSRITKEHITATKNGTRVIDIIQQKTGERVIIPMKPELDYLLKKYNYTVPKTYEQKVNKRIKDVARMAKLTAPILIEEIRGGLKIHKKIPKNELIKTHTARRTGCTNMYLAGIPGIDIMKISGHKTEKEFLGYIKVSKEETAQNLAEHPYFSANSNLKIVK